MASPNDGNLFVPLDVAYYDDADIIRAGEKAEVLYIRALAFMKRNLTDGFIAKEQLPRLGLGAVAGRVAALLREELWQEVKGGYYCPAYLKRNKSKADIKETQRLERVAAAIGNHRKWKHAEREVLSPRCPVCRGEVTDPMDDPTRVPDDDPTRVPDRGGESTETETETETETGIKDLGEPPTASRRERTPDLVFEAVCEVCGYDLQFVTDDERGRANKAAKQLRDVEPAEILRRAENYRLRFPDSPLSPQALTRNFTLCETGPPAPAPRRDANANQHNIERILGEVSGLTTVGQLEKETA